MMLIFTFVPNWHCFKLSSDDSVSTFFGCFCFWSWWLWAAHRLTFMNRILSSLQFYLVSSSSAAPWPAALPLQLRDPIYGNGDTNTFSKRMFEQFTEYLTGWQLCQVTLSSGPRWELCPQTPATTPPPTANPLASLLRYQNLLHTYTHSQTYNHLSRTTRVSQHHNSQKH